MSNRDLLLVQDVVMILVVAVLLVNFVVDLLYVAHRPATAGGPVMTPLERRAGRCDVAGPVTARRAGRGRPGASWSSAA